MTESSSKLIRSPSYPNMSLKDAVDKVGAIEEKYRSSPIDRLNAARLIGFSSLSGPANKALAALASYGLVERAGKGEIRVSQRARAILHADDAGERKRNLRDAALEPDLFRDLEERFSGIIPPEEGVVTYLRRKGFNSSAVKPATKAFLETVSFTKEFSATDSHGSGLGGASESRSGRQGATTGAYGGASVGDFIQWESQGALQFPKPRRVQRVSDDGQWVAVEGSETGIPMDQVIVESAGHPVQSSSNSRTPTSMADNSRPPEDGEVEWMRNQLGQDTKVRLFVTGDMGPKEIGKLIKILEAQKLVLEDD